MLEIENHIKYYEYWRINYGSVFVLKHFINITIMYNSLKAISIAYDMEEHFQRFFKQPVRRRRFFTYRYLGNLTKSWEDRRAINYQIYLQGVFNG